MNARLGFLKSIILSYAIILFFVMPTTRVLAQATSTDASDCPAGSICLTNPLGVETVPELIASILKAAMGVVGALALLVFIYGGFRWLTSGGDSAKVSAGKEAMKWAAVGLVVIFTSYGLVSFVFSAITG